MTIIKWKNHPGLFNLLDDMERDFFTGGRRTRCAEPKVNIIEAENSFEIQVAVPGVKKEDINLLVEKSSLTVSFERKESEAGQGKEFIRQEFMAESFSRSFSIPEKVNTEKISAQHQNGVLQILLPKVDAEKTQISKSIKIS